MALYETPTVPLGKVPVIVNGAGAMTTVCTPLVAWAGALASVTFTVTVDEPDVVGVPLTTHPLSESPAGSVPVMEHAYGVVPPVAVMFALYETPTVPLGRTLVSVSGELMVMETAAVAEAPTLSVTLTVKAEVPFVVGIPEMMPVLGEIANPGGSVPALMLHE